MGNCWRSAATRDDRRVYVWNVRRGALASVLQGHTGYDHQRPIRALRLPAGDLELGRHDPALGRAPRESRWRWRPGSLRGSFAPDDRRLAFVVGGKIGVWDVAVDAECRTLHPGMLGNRSEMRDAAVCARRRTSAPTAGCWRPATADGVRLWEADTGRELAHLKSGYCETVLFHPDGQA